MIAWHLGDRAPAMEASRIKTVHAASSHESIARSLQEVSGTQCTAIITVRAPFAPLSTFLAAVPRPMSMLWHPPDGIAVATAGVTHRIDVAGRNRLAELRRRANEIWRRVVLFADESMTIPRPRMYGGLSFAPGGCAGEPWSEFSEGCFVLPRWSYGRGSDNDAFLSLAVRGEDDDGMLSRQRILEELDEILAALHAYEGEITSMRQFITGAISARDIEQSPIKDWNAHIEAIQRIIASGRFQKVVAARRCVVSLSRPRDDLDVLTRLIAEPQCTRFAFRREHASFIGASPELLFAKAGREVRTQALAGTIRSLGSELPLLNAQSNRLLQSEKDREEHEIVVQQIFASLAPLSEELDHPDGPQIRKVRSILHLNTPFHAKVRVGVDPIDLLSAMHPTPAVGGLPPSEVTEWISRHERHPRGWYTGAVGWMDWSGDSAFVVAIRSGVITSSKAYVFTGAGIVSDSEPAAEYAETGLKQRPLLNALGVEFE